MMTESPGTVRFAFRAGQFEVEFRGAEAFVLEQIGLVRERVRAELTDAGPGPAAGAAPGPAPAAGSPLENFFAGARTREGRGSLQDSILLFAWYLIEHQKKREFSIEDLNFCFDLLDLPRPKSLANTLGILKRDRGWLQAGEKRGTYTLTLPGRERIKPLLDA